MDIETKHASLDTLAVTIQALHVSGKQMTLAVFRQLPRLIAYLEDGSLGVDLTHWGLVRYTIKDDGELWLVASRNGILYRCDAANPSRSVSRAERELDEARSALWKYIAWEDADIEYETQKAEYRSATEARNIQKDALEKQCPFPSGGALFLQWVKARLPPEPDYPSQPESDLRYSEKKRGQRGGYAEEVDMMNDALELAKRFALSHTKLLELPQLFIAV